NTIVADNVNGNYYVGFETEGGSKVRVASQADGLSGPTYVVTNTTVASSSSTSVFGQAVTFTATVSVVGPGAGTATGTVTFMDGSNTLGTGTLDSSGHATFTASYLSVGTHTITVTYGGSANFLASSSPVLTQTVLSAQQEAAVIGNQVGSLVTTGVLDS